jgi:NAD(P)-dependent dehydrogenase (short-subunit alcohol dehydrogenase family)
LAENTEGRRRTALITGASLGLGQATAVALARDGYDVAVTDLKTDMLTETMGLLASNQRSLAVALDVRSQDSIDQAIKRTVEEFGQLDVLVNNAGRQLKKVAVDITWDEWDDVMAINLKGAYFMATAFARYCLAAGRPGAIVNIASTHGITGWPEQSVYGTSKAGLAQVTRMLAVEWAPNGIRVNAVAPGAVETPTRLASLTDPVKRPIMLSRIPMGRFPEAKEIAAAVRYLASPDAGAVTGHTLVVDCGTTVV